MKGKNTQNKTYTKPSKLCEKRNERKEKKYQMANAQQLIQRL